MPIRKPAKDTHKTSICCTPSKVLTLVGSGMVSSTDLGYQMTAIGWKRSIIAAMLMAASDPMPSFELVVPVTVLPRIEVIESMDV